MRVLAAVATTVICVLFLWHAIFYLQISRWGTPLAIYTILVSGYVLSRFVMAAMYRPPVDVGHEPTVAVVVPAYNEGEAVARTIHACRAVDYPAEKIEMVVVDDGSVDDTWQHMTAAAAHYPAGAVRLIELGSNQGKRAAMAAGIRATSAEVLIFVDSDSVPSPAAFRRIVQGLADKRVGSISGITHVRNAYTNTLTRMQMARYFVSFQLLKAAESVVGAVACCSGCFAAYRREAVMDVLDAWEEQTFLGAPCTHGDDRALTNRLLRNGWVSLYDSSAEAWTDAPDRYGKFFRQQLRWKKSWCREGLILLGHTWRTHPKAFPFIFTGTVAGLLSPLVLLLNLSQPAISGQLPAIYLLGLFLVSMAYALFYRSMRNDGLWLYAFIGTYFYIAFCFQLWWAMIRIRDGAWGTRELDDAGSASADGARGPLPGPSTASAS